MPIPARGDLWLVDLGITAKTRPMLILSIPPDDADRNLITGVSRSLSARGGNFEIPHSGRQLGRGLRLEDGVFVCNQIITVDRAKLTLRVMTIDDDTLIAVEDRVREWLAL